MSPRAQIATFVACLSFALALHVVVRRERERVHLAFGAFATAVALLQAAIVRREFEGQDGGRLVSVATVVVALAAMRFFRAFVRDDSVRESTRSRLSPLLSVPVLGLLASPLGAHPAVDYAVAGFVCVSFGTTLVRLDAVRRSTRSRRDAERIRFLTAVGAVAGLLTLSDFLPFASDVDLGAVPPFFLVGFLYVLSQAVVRERMLDLYDLGVRAGVLATLSMVLAGVMTGLGRLTGTHSFAPAAVASVAVMLVMEPLRAFAERWIHRLFFGDRRELARRLTDARRLIAASIDPTSAARIAIEALEATGRVTHAAVYVRAADGRGFVRADALTDDAAPRLEASALRPVLDALGERGALVLEALEHEVARLRRRGQPLEAESAYEAASRLDALDAAVVVAIRSADSVVGLLTVRDARQKDAFADEEVAGLVGLGASLAEAYGRSLEHRQAKDRERLVSLGAMAAGLAHEIRNPLGAIRATAQLLTDPADVAANREMLDILREEVDRLNGVVAGFLDYARPTSTAEATCDPARTVERTVQLLAAEPLARGPALDLSIDADLPEVRIDAEKLRQVVWNLARNALEALDGRGTLSIAVRRAESELDGGRVTVSVADDGPGIPDSVRAQLFVPFVTSKPRGTGLGLATCQRIVDECGGRIELRTPPRRTVFVVHLPVVRPGGA